MDHDCSIPFKNYIDVYGGWLHFFLLVNCSNNTKKRENDLRCNLNSRLLITISVLKVILRIQEFVYPVFFFL